MRLLLTAGLLIALAFSAQGQERRGVRYINDSNFTQVKRTNDWSENRSDGKCRIRVRIDDEADVELRWDTIRIRVIQGAPGRDEGSECNAPLPRSGQIRNFRFNGVDGRGTPRLVQEPSSRNGYIAAVNVKDSQGGSEGYTFDLSWQSQGSGSGGSEGGFFPGDGGNTGGGGGGFFPGDGGSLPDINTSMTGNGSLSHGGNRYSLTEASVNIRGNTCRITVISDRNARVEMTGYPDRNGGRCTLTGSSNGNLRGNARLNLSGNRVTRISLDGTLNGQSFNGNFNPR